MLQWLPVALALVKADNITEYLLNETCQIIHFLMKEKKLLKKYISI